MCLTPMQSIARHYFNLMINSETLQQVSTSRACVLQARFKSSKFEIRPEEVQQLETDLGALCAPSLKANLFAKDFKKQVQAADAIKNWLMDKQQEVRVTLLLFVHGRLHDTCHYSMYRRGLQACFNSIEVRS